MPYFREGVWQTAWTGVVKGQTLPATLQGPLTAGTHLTRGEGFPGLVGLQCKDFRWVCFICCWISKHTSIWSLSLSLTGFNFIALILRRIKMVSFFFLFQSQFSFPGVPSFPNFTGPLPHSSVSIYLFSRVTIRPNQTEGKPHLNSGFTFGAYSGFTRMVPE